MSEPEIALAFSPEPWFEELHRHLSDHGGARVRQVVMDPALAFVEQYDVLVVSHRWPALTRGFVERAHADERSVLGVHDPAELPAREFLEGVGVDGVVANDATMAEFLDALVGVVPATATSARATRDGLQATGRRSGSASDHDDLRPGLTAIAGTPGAGRTEIALALATVVARSSEPVLLLDADELAPSLQQRLGRPIEPNIRTAIEAVVYGAGDPARSTTPVGTRTRSAGWAPERRPVVTDPTARGPRGDRRAGCGPPPRGRGRGELPGTARRGRCEPLRRHAGDHRPSHRRRRRRSGVPGRSQPPSRLDRRLSPR